MPKVSPQLLCVLRFNGKAGLPVVLVGSGSSSWIPVEEGREDLISLHHSYVNAEKPS